MQVTYIQRKILSGIKTYLSPAVKYEFLIVPLNSYSAFLYEPSEEISILAKSREFPRCIMRGI
jgi:hypothetical protein